MSLQIGRANGKSNFEKGRASGDLLELPRTQAPDGPFDPPAGWNAGLGPAMRLAPRPGVLKRDNPTMADRQLVIDRARQQMMADFDFWLAFEMSPLDSPELRRLHRQRFLSSAGTFLHMGSIDTRRQRRNLSNQYQLRASHHRLMNSFEFWMEAEVAYYAHHVGVGSEVETAGRRFISNSALYLSLAGLEFYASSQIGRDFDNAYRDECGQAAMRRRRTYEFETHLTQRAITNKLSARRPAIDEAQAAVLDKAFMARSPASSRRSPTSWWAEVEDAAAVECVMAGFDPWLDEEARVLGAGLRFDFDENRSQSAFHQRGFEQHALPLLQFTGHDLTADRLGAQIDASYYDLRQQMAIRNATSRAYESKLAKDIAAARAQSKQRPAPAVQPQDLQSTGDITPASQPKPAAASIPAPQGNRDVAAVLAATTGKMAATPQNIHAAAVEQHRPLAEELAAIPVTKSNEEVMEDLALERSRQAEANLDELLDDIRDGLVNFDERANKNGVVLLVFGCWLRRGTNNIYFERPGIVQGVTVATRLSVDGPFIYDIRRGEIRDLMRKSRDKTAAEAAAESGSSRETLRDVVEHTPAVDEIGEYAKSAGRVA